MKLTISDVEHIARLARIQLSEEEKTQYADQLSVIFDYVEQLNDVDTEGVEETCQVTGLENVVREDVVEDMSEDMRADIIAQFPDRKDLQLRVQEVFGE